VNINILVCQIIGPAAAGSAGPVPTPVRVPPYIQTLTINEVLPILQLTEFLLPKHAASRGRSATCSLLHMASIAKKEKKLSSFSMVWRHTLITSPLSGADSAGGRGFVGFGRSDEPPPPTDAPRNQRYEMIVEYIIQKFMSNGERAAMKKAVSFLPARDPTCS